MRIVVGSGAGEPRFVTARGLIDGLKALGHEVQHVGASYWDRAVADIIVDDRPFPELYSYTEILEKLPWTPDIAIAVEPHFLFCGHKPPELKSAYLICDPHRGAVMWRKMADVGNYDVVFCTQKVYMPCFRNIKPRLEYLPQAFDERRFDKKMDAPIFADVVLVGQAGIAGMEYPYQDDIGRFATHPPANLPQDKTRFAFWENGSFEYAERAEIFIRLCRDFQVRMYTGLWDIEFQRGIQAGAIGVQRSLRDDVTLRCFETMGAGRLLITDEIPYQEELFQDGVHCRTYKKWFSPLFANFDCDYEQVYTLVRYYLDHHREWEEICAAAKEHVWANHSWKRRAQELLNLL